MNAPLPPVDWTEANQRLLVAEFARIKHRLAGADDPSALAEIDSLRGQMPYPAAIDALAQIFGLSEFERDVVLLAAGVEMDSGLAAQCGEAPRQPQRPWASFGLALAMLAEPHWSALTPARPLRRWRLVEIDDAAGLAQGRLRIDERVLHYLAGANYLDVRLRSLFRPAPHPALMADTHRRVANDVRERLESVGDGEIPVIWLAGDDEHGQADVAAETASALGLELHVLHARDLPGGHAEIEALATLWEREATLLSSTLLVRGGAEPLSAGAIRFIEQLRALVFVAAAQPQPLERALVRAAVDKAGPLEQKRLWEHALGSDAARVNGALDGIASQFKLSARTIHAEGRQLASLLAASDEPGRNMWSAARALGRSRLDELAQRIEAGATWDDLILPDAQKATLRRIGAHVRNRLKVQLDWGFAERGARSLGISALFCGESGTGKTMAVEVLAGELQLDLFRIDLSAVVSKYIGETEKNLKRVFDAAEDSGAILLFDEADALFGKRSEVKDSHDRYANIEVSYLLQRMEAYRGLAVLTTNQKSALDAAFHRRLRFIVHFPFPDQTLREAIWRSVFPGGAPRASLDYAKLARLAVTGGSIRNIALDAAFRAAEQLEPISMVHLLEAAHHEAGKRERAFSVAETRGWA